MYNWLEIGDHRRGGGGVWYPVSAVDKDGGNWDEGVNDQVSQRKKQQGLGGGMKTVIM